MTSESSVLIIDDEEIMREVFSRVVAGAGHRVLLAASGEEGLDLIRREQVDLVLLDLMLPGIGGLETLEKILDLDPDLAVIMVTAYASIENAVQATRLGAFDFVTKPFRNEELLLVIKNGIRQRRLELENQQLKSSLRHRQGHFQNIVGQSEPIRRVTDLITQVGPGRSTVLITGESGTGKELVAKAIHNLSPRRGRSFVPVNSGSIPSELLESELFGHVKGAFTGATATKKGLFEIAHGGTLFLDEIGTVPMQTQAKLLRVLQEREFRPVGGVRHTKVDVRIVTATNVNLMQAVKEGRFREDLYYRLKVITLDVAPLRDRKDDIPLLAHHFLARFSRENGKALNSIDQDALRVMMNYDWPGNVRELENAIERAVVLSGTSRDIRSDLLPQEILDSTSGRTDGGPPQSQNGSLKELVLEFERNLILLALERANWNQRKAASLLKVKPTTLNAKLKRLQVRIPS